MNRNLFIHRVRLPEVNRDRRAEAQAPPSMPGINVFTPLKEAAQIAASQRTAVDEHQDLIASLDDLAQRAETFEGLLGNPSVSQQHEDTSMKKHQQEDEQAFDELINQTDDFERREAAWADKEERARLEKEAKLSPEQQASLNGAREAVAEAEKERCFSALHHFVEKDDLAIARQLMENNEYLFNNGNPNGRYAKGADDMSWEPELLPLERARSPEMVDLLVEHGADVSQARWSEQALDKPDVAAAFLRHGMSVEKPAVQEGLPPLFACENPEVAGMLVANGADSAQIIKVNESILRLNDGAHRMGGVYLRPDQRFDLAADGSGFERQDKSAAFAEAIGTAPGQAFHTSKELRTKEDDVFRAREALGDYRTSHPLEAMLGHSANIKQLNQGVANAEKDMAVQLEHDQSLSHARGPERMGQLDVQPKRDQASAMVNNPSPQHQEKPMEQKEKFMTAEESRAAAQHMPRSLGAAVGVAMPPRADKQSQGSGQGGRQGGQERPSEASYYNPLPIGGVAMPKRGSDIGDAVIQQEMAQKRRRTRSI
jgi:hypothetical protein